MLLWSGDFVSAIGSGLTSFGLGVYIFQQTGKASQMALVTLLAFLPSLLLGPMAGVLADRYDRRLLMILGDSLSAVGLLFILVSLMHGEALLWQICVGVTVSSVFASLLEPAYKATITELLNPEQYSKASGLVQIAGSAKYLISPVLAGFLLTISDIRLLLFLDICTFFVTVATTLVVKKGLPGRKAENGFSFAAELKAGWEALAGKKGVLTLVFMALFGLRENIVFIGAAGFLFFAMLPFTNASLDYLLRTNIENDLQGRAWGLIGLISQLGYVAAYAVSGLLADYMFTPLLLDGGALSENVGKIIGTGPGRGIGFLMILAGLLLCVTSGLLFCMKSIRNLESGGLYDT